MSHAHEVTTRTHHVWLDDEGIVHARTLPGSEHTRQDAEEAIAAIAEVAGGKQLRPLLVDLRPTKSMDRAARAHYAGGGPPGFLNAVALMIGSPLTRILVSFFTGLNKPLVPTQVFTSEAEALAWLRTFVA